jgi:ATP-binding cassette subfamily F protein 3
MIQIDSLSMAYGGQPLFNEATFSLQQGERCGCVGRNGSGKTTLFRILMEQESSDAGTVAIRKHYTLGMLDQHIRFTQSTLIEEAALGLRESEKDHIYKAERILFGLGFNESNLEQSPASFSGGYQLRLHLAKLLIAEPDCLLLDEPTNYLDIVSIRWFTRFLQQWPGEFILISHDREFMDSVTTHTIGIHRQKIRKYQGGTGAFFERLLQEEETHEQTRLNVEKKRAHAQSFIERFGAKATKATQAQSRQKMLDRMPVLEQLKKLNALDFRFNEAAFPGHNMLEIKNLSFSYTPETSPSLLSDIALTVAKGERIAIIGKNGRGKSTLLKLMAGELEPIKGTVRHADNLAIGYFGQTNIDRLNPKNTIEDEISLANPRLNLTQVKGICGLMMFSGDKANKQTTMLSGGEKSRVLLGKILAAPCNLLLLDEPTHHLDMESIEALIDALEQFKGAIIVVTHSELMLKQMNLSQIVVCRQNSQELFQGTYEEFLEKDGWHEEGEVSKPVKKASNQNNKHQRTALTSERSKALKSFDTKIAKLEKSITELEIQQQQAESKLLEVSAQGQGSIIQTFGREIGARSKQIESLYTELEVLMDAREECSNTFTQQIEALNT